MAQRDAGDFRPLRDPGGLQVVDVIEHDPAQRDHSEVFAAVGLDAAESSAARLEIPGDEGGEPSGRVLQLADAHQMFQAVLDAVNGAVHHGGGGSHPQRMRITHDAEPFAGGFLVRRDLLADFIGKNFAARAGNGVQSRGSQT